MKVEKTESLQQDVYCLCQQGSLMSFLKTTYAQQQPDPCSLTTSYGLRFYKEGLFSTPTNFSSSNPSFPDLARWRHTLDNIPETMDINRTLLLSPCSPDDHALMTSSTG